MVDQFKRWAGHVACMEEVRNACKMLVGKVEKIGLLGRPRRMWEGDIRIDLREIGWEVVDWMHLA